MKPTIWIETLGCAKNEVDSDKVAFRAATAGIGRARSLASADLVVVNTCAFIESAREESIAAVLDALEAKKDGAKVVVTGCMAERYQGELAEALPEVDVVAGFEQDFVGEFAAEAGVALSLGPTRRRRLPVMDLEASYDLLNLPAGPSKRPFAYLKAAEGCDRKCGFCAIPSFRGRQRSRGIEDLVAEARTLGSKEIVVVAQDLASYGKDLYGSKRLVELMGRLEEVAHWIRLVYVYPSELTDELIDAVGGSRVRYFDLSLQHVSRPLLRRMRRPGGAESYLRKIDSIRGRYPDAVFRSNFIVGYPGESEEDHDALLDFLERARLDWVAFFPYSREAGTYADGLDGHVAPALAAERLAEAAEVADRISLLRRAAQVGRDLEVIVQRRGEARSYMEAPEIDGLIRVPDELQVGGLYNVRVSATDGIDLIAAPTF
ncbi:MAG: 30S ribosomal protein S12 methylthiotransferase RimO [Actinomycetota bacterium]|nr:30S ribosomal protein S12 methylthiotransferase RimO [Actinomycetota bacterium]